MTIIILELLQVKTKTYHYLINKLNNKH